MAVIKVKGIIIREVLYRESDKLLTILTKNDGLINVYAKHARKPGKKMLTSTSVLSYGEFEISQNLNKGNFLNHASIIEGFSKLKDDLVLLTYCSHITELIYDSMADETSSMDIYLLTIYTMHNMSKGVLNPEFITGVFELKLLFVIGFLPVLDSCVICRLPINTESGIFSFDCEGGGMTCHGSGCSCNSRSKISISGVVYQALKYISESDFARLYSFRLEDKYIKELTGLSRMYINEKFEKGYTRLDMLNDFII